MPRPGGPHGMPGPARPPGGPGMRPPIGPGMRPPGPHGMGPGPMGRCRVCQEPIISKLDKVEIISIGTN